MHARALQVATGQQACHDVIAGRRAAHGNVAGVDDGPVRQLQRGCEGIGDELTVATQYHRVVAADQDCCAVQHGPQWLLGALVRPEHDEKPVVIGAFSAKAAVDMRGCCGLLSR